MERLRPDMPVGELICEDAQATFDLGERFGEALGGGEAVLLDGGLGAGKTLFTKGILYGLDFDPDEVTSPSFTLVNLYRTPRFDVYHLDLWRIDERADAASAVGLAEILEDEKAVVVVEWSSRLGDFEFPGRVIRVAIEGDGDDPRRVAISVLK